MKNMETSTIVDILVRQVICDPAWQYEAEVVI